MLYEVMETRGTYDGLCCSRNCADTHPRAHMRASRYLYLTVHLVHSLISEIIALCHQLQCFLLSFLMCVCVCVRAQLNPSVLAGPFHKSRTRFCRRYICLIYDLGLAFILGETYSVSFVCMCMHKERASPNQGRTGWPLPRPLMHPRPPQTGWQAE